MVFVLAKELKIDKMHPSMVNSTPEVRQYDILRTNGRGAVIMGKGKPNKRYTAEYKTEVIETMRREHLSYNETAQRFEVNDHHRIQAWERIYLEEGSEGLRIERRGRGSTERPRKQSVSVAAEEDLLAEVQRLRAENDYLKNLQALVLEDERHLHKKRR